MISVSLVFLSFSTDFSLPLFFLALEMYLYKLANDANKENENKQDIMRASLPRLPRKGQWT